jgi:hypothetical protein
MSMYNLTPTPVHLTKPEAASAHNALPPIPELSTTPPLLTTLRAHQTMLLTLYEGQYAGYLNTLSTLTAETPFTGAKELVSLLLDQQREVLLFQGFLGRFQEFVVALEGNEVKVEMEKKEVIGKDGGIGGGSGVWKGVHGVLR